MTSLQTLQQLYDQHRFLDAFSCSSEYWCRETDISKLSSQELVLGGRLASRLGGWRLARHLFRAALARDPEDSTVRYFAEHLRRRQPTLLETLRSIESDPEQLAEPLEMRPVWLAYHAVVWASLRDFAKAHSTMDRAFALSPHDPRLVASHSQVYAYEERWQEAAQAAQHCWKLDEGRPRAAELYATALLNLGRVEEASAWLARAAQDSQSYEIVHAACWYQCALAETLQGGPRAAVLQKALAFAERLPVLLPLADRDSKALLARARLDIAELSDDRLEIERWAKGVPSAFYRHVLKNRLKNPGGDRLRLAFSHSIQRHDECLPTSVASALSTMGWRFSAESLARELTYGGTAEWAAADWLAERGFVVRFFTLQWDLAAHLIRNGIGFVLSLQGDDTTHAVAVVGVDESSRTFIIHDPNEFRETEYLAESFEDEPDPLGCRCMVIVPQDRAALVDSVLSPANSRLATAAQRRLKVYCTHGPSAAREALREIESTLASHSGTRYLSAIQALDEGRVGEAFHACQVLSLEFAHSPAMRSALIGACRALGNTSVMRAALVDVVDRGVLPGGSSHRNWRFPPARYVVELADLLRASAESREKAVALLSALLRRMPSWADAWHSLADILTDQQDVEGALLAYRVASCLDRSSEYHAQSYCDALCRLRRYEEGLGWLKKRVEEFGAMRPGAGSWITWIRTLEDWGYPERSVAACAEAIARQPNSPELLSFVAPFLGRMGRWEEADQMLVRLEQTRSVPLFLEAAYEVARMRGELKLALSHAQSWCAESPTNMRARYAWARTVAALHGSVAAAALAAPWVAQYPGHDEMEALLCGQYSDSDQKSKSYALLRRRVKRNPQDAWAWRELAFLAISACGTSSAQRQAKRSERAEAMLAECERTAPGDAATIRLRALWHETNSRWVPAVEEYLEAVAREPEHGFPYTRLWNSSSTFADSERHAVWRRLEGVILRSPRRLDIARDVGRLLAERFGVAAAEQILSGWMQFRPQDPEVCLALADLLLDYGHGRSDAARALAFLKPAVEKYPYHLGFRISLCAAHHALGEFELAEKGRREIILRHPGQSHGYVQLALALERQSKSDESSKLFEVAAEKEPQNGSVRCSQAHFLIRAGRLNEARSLINEVLGQIPADVAWRERAIGLLEDCGDTEAAIATAREGVRVYPRGAFLWYLLGQTLARHPQFAGAGEVEDCYRRAILFNATLFEATDALAIILVEQRAYDEAEQLVRAILPRMADPSPARGRLAWIHRSQGRKQAAFDDLSSAVTKAPWYLWGWNTLMDWLAEDLAWGTARELLGSARPELKSNTEFRRRRLKLLELAGHPAAEIETEWRQLLNDFSEDLSLHLIRYDVLHDAKRLDDAVNVLEAAAQIDADNPFFLARRIEAHAEKVEPDEALLLLATLFFLPVENSRWPVDYAWAAAKRANWLDQAYIALTKRITEGAIPTERAFFVLVSNALARGGAPNSRPSAWDKFWLSGLQRGAKEVIRLLTLVESASENGTSYYRAAAYSVLLDEGQHRIVLDECRKQNFATTGIETWCQTARALVAARKHSEARKFLASWRTRIGVGMWVVGNYVLCFRWPRNSNLREVASACRDALSTLPHDHCARYLAHRLAASCAMLGDKEGFLAAWKLYRPYFDHALLQHEWFDNPHKYLLDVIPQLAARLEGDQRFLFWFTAWRLRFKQAFPPQQR